MHDPSEDHFDPDVRLVPFSRRDLNDAQRLIGLLTDAAQQKDHKPSHEQLLGRAREIFTHRRKRLEIFGKDMFGEPAFEMLLLLYMAQRANRYTVGQLGQLSGASKSTASRWIDYLEREQLIERQPHPTDLRLSFVKLSDKGAERTELYLTETLASEA